MPTAPTPAGNFTLDADGTLTGSVDSSHFGPEGADLRLFLKYTDEKERRDAWETSVARDLPGVALDSFAVSCSQLRSTKPLEFRYKVTAQSVCAHRRAAAAGAAARDGLRVAAP